MKKKFLVNFVLSDKMQEFLGEIDHEISRELIALHYNPEMKFAFTCIDVTDIEGKEDVVSYIPSNKVEELIKADVNKWRRNIWTDKRSDIRVGKLIKNIFGDKFPVNAKNGVEGRPNDIESFVNAFKATMKQYHDDTWNRFEIVDGKTLVKWYRGERYLHGGGTMNSSCLRHGNDKLLDIYRNNPEQTKLLILRSREDSELIAGRALLWKLDKINGEPTDRWFMDRVYTRHDCDVHSFIRYAEKNGFLYKEKQTFGTQHNIVDPKTGKIEWMLMEVTLNNMKHKAWPYVDTLAVVERKTMKMTNDPSKIDHESKRPVSKKYWNLVTYDGTPGHPAYEEDEKRMAYDEYVEGDPEDDTPRPENTQRVGRPIRTITDRYRTTVNVTIGHPEGERIVTDEGNNAGQ